MSMFHDPKPTQQPRKRQIQPTVESPKAPEGVTVESFDGESVQRIEAAAAPLREELAKVVTEAAKVPAPTAAQVDRLAAMKARADRVGLTEDKFPRETGTLLDAGRYDEAIGLVEATIKQAEHKADLAKQRRFCVLEDKKIFLNGSHCEFRKGHVISDAHFGARDFKALQEVLKLEPVTE